jgi:hypothetical protein
LAASTAATMRPSASPSRQRTGEASISSRSAGVGTARERVATAPTRTTWLSTATPTWPSRARAAAPTATLAAVSLALARSSTGRASVKPYFCMPVRSAWPGRGRVSGAPRPLRLASGSSTGSGDITSVHLGHSLLSMRIASGEPRVRPCRRPPSTSSRSSSKRMRLPRP